MEVRRSLGCFLVGLDLAACGTARAGPAGSLSAAPEATSENPCSGYTCDGPGAQLHLAYSYRLSTHCGVLATRFDGRTFYVEAVDPSTVTSGLNNPEDLGTMTLLSSHVALFRTASGSVIRFVDSPPGVVGQPYPFRVYVLSGGNRLIERGFAGRLWRALGTLPGVVGPPYGNGQDRFTVVDGTMTLIGPDAAVFRTDTGAQVPYAPEGPLGCD